MNNWSKNNKFVSADSISSITDNYVEIGYGLPTEFTSPTVEYSIYNYSLNKYNSILLSRSTSISLNVSS